MSIVETNLPYDGPGCIVSLTINDDNLIEFNISWPTERIALPAAHTEINWSLVGEAIRLITGQHPPDDDNTLDQPINTSVDAPQALSYDGTLSAIDDTLDAWEREAMRWSPKEQKQEHPVDW